MGYWVLHDVLLYDRSPATYDILYIIQDSCWELTTSTVINLFRREKCASQEQNPTGSSRISAVYIPMGHSRLLDDISGLTGSRVVARLQKNMSSRRSHSSIIVAPALSISHRHQAYGRLPER